MFYKVFQFVRGIAQLVEHRSPKPSVEGSNPSAPANFYGEMAEWSNAVDSKSIVRFTAYLGFESLSHRQ